MGKLFPLRVKRAALISWGVVVLASIVNILPMVFYHPGGDVLIHFIGIDCFSKQFWAGDFYPRWCMEADAGLGSPLLLFYYPVSYYIAALFYPLGIGLRWIYVAVALISSIAMAVGVRRLLAPYFNPRVALIVACLALFLPYRMELMVFRMALAELVAMAWLPFLFAAVMDNAANKRFASLRFAFWGWLMVLTHLPLAIYSMFAAFVLAAFVNWPRQWPGIRLAFASLLALVGSTIYTLPAAYYAQFIRFAQVMEERPPWPNTFVRWLDVGTRTSEKPLIGLAFTLILLAIFMVLAWRRRENFISHKLLRRGTLGFATLVALAFYLMHPWSEPAWSLLQDFHVVSFPWRMQALAAIALIWFIALYIQYLRKVNGREAGDLTIAAAFTAMFSYFLVSSVQPSDYARLEELMDARTILYDEYRTVWTTRGYYGAEYALVRYQQRKSTPRVQVISGEAGVTVQEWSSKKIVLLVDAMSESELQLALRFFPTWKARLDGLPHPDFAPEQASGFTVTRIPKGKHLLTLTFDVNEPWQVLLANLSQ